MATFIDVVPLVEARFDHAQAFADARVYQAEDFLNGLWGLMSDDLEIDSDIAMEVDTTSTETNFPTVIAPVEVTMETVDEPPEPTINEISVVGVDIPGYDIVAEAIDLPERPTTPSVPDVGEAPSIADILVPNSPTIDSVAVPTMRDITIPTSPEFETIAFEGVMPIDDLDLPITTFSYEEAAYQSDLLTNTKNKLNDLVVNGGTGLGADIEDAIWNREAERAELALVERKDALAAEWAERGFDLPNGVLTSLLLDLDREYTNQRLTSGREIAIKQAEIAKEETQFALKQASDLEGTLMKYASEAAQRSLEAAKFVIDCAIQAFNARINRYNAEIEGYKAQAAVYETRIRAMLARVEVFKAQIDSQKLIGEINSINVDLYGKMLTASNILIERYKTEMDAAQVRMGIEKLRIDSYKARIDSYTSTVQLHVAQFNMYEAGVRGELAKVQIYQAQVEAYKSRVEASKVTAEINIETAKIGMDGEKLKVEVYGVNIEAYKVRVQAEVARVTAIVDIYKAQLEGFKAQTEGEAARIDAVVKAFVARVQQNIAVANTRIEVAKTEVEAWKVVNELQAEVLKTGASVYAQLAASAYSTINCSGQLQGQSQTSSADNYQTTDAYEVQHVYRHDE